jgi:hypothetical protein
MAPVLRQCTLLRSAQLALLSLVLSCACHAGGACQGVVVGVPDPQLLQELTRGYSIQGTRTRPRLVWCRLPLYLRPPPTPSSGSTATHYDMNRERGAGGVGRRGQGSVRSRPGTGKTTPGAHQHRGRPMGSDGAVDSSPLLPQRQPSCHQRSGLQAHVRAQQHNSSHASVHFYARVWSTGIRHSRGSRRTAPWRSCPP